MVEDTECMNIEIIQDEFEVYIALEKARKLVIENKTRTFQCKGCKLGRLTLSKIEEHFKKCELRTDNWGYRAEIFHKKKIG